MQQVRGHRTSSVTSMKEHSTEALDVYGAEERLAAARAISDEQTEPLRGLGSCPGLHKVGILGIQDNGKSYFSQKLFPGNHV